MDDPQDPDAERTMLFAEQQAEIEWPIPRLFKEYGPRYTRLLALAVVATIVAPLAALVPPFILQIAIDSVLVPSGGTEFTLPGVPAAWLPADRLDQLYLITALIVGAAGASALFSWLSSWTWGRFSQSVQHELRTDSYEKIQALGVDFFDSQQTGQILAILNDDVNQLNELLEQFLQDIVRIGVQFTGITVLLLYLHWQLGIVALASVPAIALVSRYFIKRIRPKYEAVRQQVGALNARVENNVSGIEVIKSYTAEAQEAGRVQEASERVYDARWDVISSRIKFFPSVNFINWLGFGLLIALGGVWIVRGPPLFFTKPLSVGVLVAFLVYNQQFTTPLIKAGRLVDQYYDARASARRVFALRDYEVDIVDSEDAVTLESVDGDVVFDDVSFGYDAGEEYAISGVDLEVPAGSFVGIVGPTGSGKTTLTKLLLRYYDPDEGTVRIDGHDLRDVDLRSLRASISIVSQEPYLFTGTVRENIRYGSDVSDQEIGEAALMANAHNFITDLPNGYDTQVGQRGVRLSGGQRQRIAIARAIISDPDVLVLDEATSHVDNETEAMIQHSLADIVADRTTFAVAHRLSTVRHADTILVLDDGEIVEQGTHEELLEVDGLYANLWRVQVGEVDSLPDEFLRRHVA